MNGQPNILLILTDQQRFDSLGCYGCDIVPTPHLDALATRGALFENCYVNNPLCTPSRASLMTGRHVPGHGVSRLYDSLPTENILFPQLLKEVGYETALFGKLHVSSRFTEADTRHPHDGFDIYEWCHDPRLHLDSDFNGYARWLRTHHPSYLERLQAPSAASFVSGAANGSRNVPRSVHMTHWAAERTIDYLRTRDGRRPFFVMMSLFDPHDPYDDHPIEMLEHVAMERIPTPLGIPHGTLPLPEAVQREMRTKGGDGLTSEQALSMRAGYFASIALIDLEVGRVLNALEEVGAEDETLVIFVSDHGDMLGDRNLWTKGAFFYDPCVKVPLMMRWPNVVAPGTRVPGLVQLHDLAATIASAAGIAPEFLTTLMPDARNLAPLWAGELDQVHESVVCTYRNSGLAGGGKYFDPPIHGTMIRDDRYKLVVYHDVETPGRGELFDLAEDPGESVNLWDETAFASTRHRLTEQLLHWVFTHEVRQNIAVR